MKYTSVVVVVVVVLVAISGCVSSPLQEGSEFDLAPRALAGPLIEHIEKKEPVHTDPILAEVQEFATPSPYSRGLYKLISEFRVLEGEMQAGSIVFCHRFGDVVVGDKVEILPATADNRTRESLANRFGHHALDDQIFLAVPADCQ